MALKAVSNTVSNAELVFIHRAAKDPARKFKQESDMI